MARPKFNWPATGHEIGGLMGFSAEWVDYTAADYKHAIEGQVMTLLHEYDALECQLNEQRTQEQDLEIKLSKLRASLIKHDENCESGKEFGVKNIEVFMEAAEEALQGGGKVHVRMTPKGMEYAIEYKVEIAGGVKFVTEQPGT